MKRLMLACALAAAFLAPGAAPEMPFTIDPLIPRKISIGKNAVLTLAPDKFDIVECQQTPTVKLAAKEIADALSAAFGADIRSVRESTGKPVEIRVGDAELAAKLGAP